MEQGYYDTRLRLAVLPDWDGVTWHMNADYRNAGRVLPPVPHPPGYQSTSDGVPPLTIEERITIEELKGRLLPAVSAPQRVEGIRIAYDQSVGSLLNSTPLTPGVSYTVTSVSPNVDLNLLQAADVPDGDAVARYLTVGPSVPPDMSTFAEKITLGESSPYLRALAVQTYMSEHYTYAVDAPTGHAYPNLGFFLYGEPRAGGQKGTAEQFATAFATLCRLLGLPTRVVVGFHTPAGGGIGHRQGCVGLARGAVRGHRLGRRSTRCRSRTGGRGRSRRSSCRSRRHRPPRRRRSRRRPHRPMSLRRPRRAVARATGVRSRRCRDRQRRGPLRARPVPARPAGACRSCARCRVGAGWAVGTHRDRSSVPGTRCSTPWCLPAGRRRVTSRRPRSPVTRHSSSPTVPARRHTRRPRPAAPPLDELATTVNAVAFGGRTVPGPDATDAVSARERAVAFVRALYARRSWWRRLLWRIDPRPLRRRRSS